MDEFRYICYKKFIFLMKLFKKYVKINSDSNEKSSEGKKMADSQNF